jgi:hypothetical protein
VEKKELDGKTQVYEAYPDNPMSKLVICNQCVVSLLMDHNNKTYFEHQTYKVVNLEIL